MSFCLFCPFFVFRARVLSPTQADGVPLLSGAEKPAAAIPAVQSLSPRSPHLGRASRSPKTKSAVSSPQQPMVGEPPNSPKGEVPKISTEELARMLHGGDVTPPAQHSPTITGKQSSTAAAVAGLSEQLKKKEVAAPLPVAAPAKKAQ